LVCVSTYLTTELQKCPSSWGCVRSDLAVAGGVYKLRHSFRPPPVDASGDLHQQNLPSQEPIACVAATGRNARIEVMLRCVRCVGWKPSLTRHCSATYYQSAACKPSSPQRRLPLHCTSSAPVKLGPATTYLLCC